MEFEISQLFAPTEVTLAKQQSQIMSLNDKSRKYGLALTEQQAKMIVQVGQESIRTQERVEIGESITPKIIKKFMKSAYISQNDYAETIAQLVEIFYEAKEESADCLSDSEIIDSMYYCFENISQGSTELLQSRDMEKVCRRVRYKAMGVDEEGLDD